MCILLPTTELLIIKGLLDYQFIKLLDINIYKYVDISVSIYLYIYWYINYDFLNLYINKIL